MVEYRKAPTRGKKNPQVSPRLISEWRRNAREIIRISLGQYNDCHVVDIRTWVVDADGELQPTKTGITLAAERHLAALAKGLADALITARELGIVIGPTTRRDG